MNPAKSGVSAVIVIAIEILIGIFLLMNPEGFMKTIIIIAGIGLLILGVVLMIRYITGQKDGSAGFGMLIGAIIALIFGLVCIFASRGIEWMIEVFIWVCGIFLIIAGVIKIASFFRVRNAGYATGGTALLLISGIIMTIFGILLVFHPFQSLSTLLRIGGIVLIVEAAFDLVSFIITMKNAPREVK